MLGDGDIEVSGYIYMDRARRAEAFAPTLVT